MQNIKANYKREEIIVVITAFANQKGGTGKTTACINLASCLAKRGKRVLVVDLDPLGGATTGLGVDKRNCRTTYDVLLDGNTPDCITEISSRLSIIPSSIDLAGGEVELAYKKNREKLLKRAIYGVSSSFDHVFIDCPPALGLLSLNALVCAEKLIIPVTSEYYSLEGAISTLKTMELVKSSLNPDINLLGVILGKMQGRSLVVKQLTEEIKKLFGDKLFSTYVPQSARIAECPSYGLPVIERDDNCKGAQAFNALATEFLSRE